MLMLVSNFFLTINLIYNKKKIVLQNEYIYII